MMVRGPKNVIKCDVLNTQPSAEALPDIFNAEILHIFRLKIKFDEAKREHHNAEKLFDVLQQNPAPMTPPPYNAYIM